MNLTTGLAAACLLALSGATAARADPHVTQRRLTVRLDPAERTVSGTAELDVALDGGGVVALDLASGLRLTQLTRGGAAVERLVDTDLGNGTTTWRFPLAAAESEAADAIVTLRLAWSGELVPPRGATFGADAVDLPASLRWTPTPDHPSPWEAVLDVPANLRCVLRGTPLGREDADGRARETWRSDVACAGLPLAAGPWTSREATVGGATVAVWGAAPDAALLADATAACGRIAAVLGPPPAGRFDVLPDACLSASSAPGLGAALWGDLATQAARCWWGRSVIDGPDRERWADALAAYTARDLCVEDDHPDAAAAFRRDTLAHLTSETAAVDEHRRIMAFHALREELGDDAFRAALRDVLRSRRGRVTTWEDWARAFSAAAGRDVSARVEQWTRRAGAPLLLLADVRLATIGGRLRVSGTIRQKVADGEEPWRLTVPVVVSGLPGDETLAVEVAGAETAFNAIVSSLPSRVTLDPAFRVPRLLSREPGGEPLANTLPVLPDVVAASDPRRVAALLGRLTDAASDDAARRAVLDELAVAGLSVRARQLDVEVRERAPGPVVTVGGGPVDGCRPLTCSPRTEEEGVEVAGIAFDPGDDLAGRALVVDVPLETQDLPAFARALAVIARSAGAAALVLRLPEGASPVTARGWATPADAPADHPNPTLYARETQLAGGDELALPTIVAPAGFAPESAFRVRVRWEPVNTQVAWVRVHVGARNGRGAAVLLITHVAAGADPSGAAAVAEAAQLLAPHAALLGRGVEVLFFPADGGYDAVLDEELRGLDAPPAMTLRVEDVGDPGADLVDILCARGAEEAASAAAACATQAGLRGAVNTGTRLLVRWRERRGPELVLRSMSLDPTGAPPDPDKVTRVARTLALATLAATIIP